MLSRKRIRAIALPIRQTDRAEGLLPIGAFVKPESVVERVSRFVTQIAHGFRVIFDGKGHFRFDALQSGISQVERHRNERCAIGASPLIAQIDGGAKAQSSGLELVIELLHQTLDARAPNREAEIRDPVPEELVPLSLPVFFANHTVDSGKRRTRILQMKAGAFLRRLVVLRL